MLNDFRNAATDFGLPSRERLKMIGAMANVDILTRNKILRSVAEITSSDSVCRPFMGRFSPNHCINMTARAAVVNRL